MAELTYTSLFLTTILLLTGYGITLIVYRLYLSPLSKFPGPKWAAATQWCEFYYDVIRPGQFIFYVQDLHKQYGPIVRINPHELHIADSEFYDDLYVKNNRMDKYDWMKNRFNIPTSIFNTPEADIHRIRRAPLNPMFSKKKILDLQYIVREKVDILVHHVRQAQESQQPFPLGRAYMAIVTDVASEYAFARCFNYLDDYPKYSASIQDAAMAASVTSHLFLHIPFTAFLMNNLPEKLVMADPNFALLINMQKQMFNQIRQIKSSRNNSHLDVNHPTIFHAVLESNLPESEKTDLRLSHEAQAVVAAAVTTTGTALCRATFEIVRNPSVLAKVRDELGRAIPDPEDRELDWLKLERLPYLSGCIREAIRLSYVVSARNPRLSNSPMRYKDWVIPARTPVSMTLVDLAHDETVFPDSWIFKPERWFARPGEEASRLDKYFVFFGKGSRSCLGQNLALAEMYLILAAIFRRFEFDLYETDESDFRLKYDYVIPVPKKDSKGIRVVVK